MSEFRFTPPRACGLPIRHLTLAPEGKPSSERFAFYDRIQIGRMQGGEPLPGHLQILDPTISSRHCIITQAPSWSCYIRDVSRNGTRLDGRRLVPNLETELGPGQIITIGKSMDLILEDITEQSNESSPTPSDFSSTIISAAPTTVTVLVGDIRDYTVLVRKTTSTTLQHSVTKVFEKLSEEVARLGGTVKEFQGDAVFAFWEPTPNKNSALSACGAALKLDRIARNIANDKAIWNVPDFPLQMDWALATGPVVIGTFGNNQSAALSMVGPPVVLAFRIEKFADDETGPIVVCATTRDQASEDFGFRDLGEKPVKGFSEPQRIFSLIRP